MQGLVSSFLQPLRRSRFAMSEGILLTLPASPKNNRPPLSSSPHDPHASNSLTHPPLSLSEPPQTSPDSHHPQPAPAGTHQPPSSQRDSDLETSQTVLNGSSAESDTATPEADNVTLSDSQSSTDGDQDWSSDGAEMDVRRVKVYELVGSHWTDRGTAFCNGDFDEPTQEAKLIARSETNQADILLCCSIRANDVYQRQQETLIVWTEPDGTDYALSFQDVEGCAEVWDFIVEVQRHLKNGREDTVLSSPAGSGQRPSITTHQIIQSGRLPDPQMGIIEEIEKAIRALARTATAKERICEYIQHEEYIKSMLEVFHAAEDVENITTLHALCSCMQTILLLNDHTMYEHILSDDLWLGVVGMLEYDPEFPAYKANYREFLSQSSRFLQPITIQDPTIQRKIHHTYRLQYLKDVILARALDDSTFNVLNSCIIFNQIDIINHVQNDDRFLKDVVGLFVNWEGASSNGDLKNKEKDKDDEAMDVDKPDGKHSTLIPSTLTSRPSAGRASSSGRLDDTTRRREVIFLIQQLCVMGKNVQLPARITLFRTLVERGILHAVQWALCRRNERQMVSTAGEILAVMLDHDTSGARTHVLKQTVVLERAAEAAAAKDIEKGKEVTWMGMPMFSETLVQVLCKMLATSPDMALQNQLADALRSLLDVPPPDLVGEQLHATGAKMLSRAKDDPTTERFMETFYKGSVETLFKPITNDVPEHKTLTEPTLNLSREKANLYLYLCDLLCSFALQHSFRSHFFILSSNIASRVASLLRVRDKHLCLAALRFFRICLRLGNRNLFAHIIKHDILGPVLDLTVRESRRDNLLSSTCQEFFEYMRKENVKELITHVMTRHEATMRELARSALGSATFHGVIARWDMNNEPPPKEEDKSATPRVSTRRWGEDRLLEVEEEDYFNNDDDEEEIGPPAPRPELMLPSNFHRRRRLRVNVPTNLGVPGRQSRLANGTRFSPLNSLLDYDDDDDAQSPGPHQPDSPRFADGDDSRMPESPVLAHRTIHIPPSKPAEPTDPEDDLLEALVSHVQTKSGPSVASSSTRQPVAVIKTGLTIPSMRPREKRQRDDEVDDDELMERLASKGKRASVDPEDRPKSPILNVGPVKNGDDGSKKIKLKFGTTSRLATAPANFTPSSSRPGTKDGDGG